MFPFRSHEGRIAIVTNAERDCGGRGVLCAILCADEQRFSRTAKSCGPGAPMQALSERNDPLMTVATKHGHRGEREGNR
jgi:hypothetical protein